MAAVALIMPGACFALDPGEILVVANRRVPEGIDLANYYMEKRKIPKKNLLIYPGKWFWWEIRFIVLLLDDFKYRSFFAFRRDSAQYCSHGLGRPALFSDHFS
jgi:hypothetical protein